eukprot:scaffold3608_cov183-Amphora_coffeaeformis.AAC.35
MNDALQDHGEPRGSDPWSDETWRQNDAMMNVTFDTVETDVFEFSAGESDLHQTPSDVELSLFRGGGHKVATERRNNNKGGASLPVVAVAVHEQLSAIYDDVSQEPSCHLEGTIHVKSSTDMSRHPFCLVLRDLLGHIDVLEDRPAVAKDVSKEISRKGLHRGDRVMRVSLPSTSKGKAVQIARYICTTGLRPVPLVRAS